MVNQKLTKPKPSVNNRGETKRKDLVNEICPSWQGLKDDYRTYRELNSLQGVYGNMILL